MVGSCGAYHHDGRRYRQRSADERGRHRHGDLLEKRDEKADVIVANIIADVICYLCGPVKKHLLEGGTFICSGIIKEREDDVQHALAAAGYTVCNRLAKGEWVCLAAKLA